MFAYQPNAMTVAPPVSACRPPPTIERGDPPLPSAPRRPSPLLRTPTPLPPASRWNSFDAEAPLSDELTHWRAGVTVLDVACLSRDRWLAPPFAGPLLRSALGAAVALLACAPGCRDAHHVPDCAFERAFHGTSERPPPLRLDTSGLDGRTLGPRDPWRLRLVVFQAEAVGLLTDALTLALSRGLGNARSVHDVVVVRTVAAPVVEPGVRVVRLLTPTLLARQGQALRDPGAIDLLHAARLRARSLGVPAGLPRYEDEVEVLDSWVDAAPVRWEGVDLPGVVGAWRVRVTPAQAAWFELAVLTGLGKHTAFGMGAVGVEAG